MTSIEKDIVKTTFSDQLPFTKPEHQTYWNLSLAINTGFLKNIDESGETDPSEWIPIAQLPAAYVDSSGVRVDHAGTNVEVFLGGSVIGRLDPNQETSLTIVHNELVDLHADTIELTISVTGYGDQHMALLPNGLGLRPGFKIVQLAIEGYNVMDIFSESSTCVFSGVTSVGNTILAANGDTRFSMHLPIYSWLLRHAATEFQFFR
jgi:hypothetical protein